MTTLPLYSEPCERWAFIKSGAPVAAQKRGGYGAGRVVGLPDGSFRYRRNGWGPYRAQDEPVEIRRFLSIVMATVDESGADPKIRLAVRYESAPL